MYHIPVIEYRPIHSTRTDRPVHTCTNDVSISKKNYLAVKIHPGKLEGRPAMICAKREELTSFLMYDITYFDIKKAEYRCIFKGGFQKKNYPAVKIHPGKFEDGPGKKRHLAT